MKNIFTKKIKIKDIYLILVIVLGLVTISLYSTYALFTGSVVSTEALANVNTDIHVDFDINSSKTFSLEANTMITFYANVNNHMDGPIHYELYHDLDSSVSSVLIAEVVSDPTVTKTAPNTSGDLEKGNKKTIPLVIENKSSDTITVTIGLAIGYVGNEIEYGSGNYPSNVTVITDVYDDDKVPEESCANTGNSVGDNCEESYMVSKINGVTQYVQRIECPVNMDDIDSSGANKPKLVNSIIPVKWDDSNTLVKANENNPSDDVWYDYNSKMWANAVLVNSSSRSTYQNASAGTPVKEDDILAYFVWIPRYKYTIFNQNYKTGTVSPQEINITFEPGLSKTGTINCSVDDYGVETCVDLINGSIQNGISTYTHPAFTFGEDELTGIWVAKFRLTGVLTTSVIKPGLDMDNRGLSYVINSSLSLSSTTYLDENDVELVDSHLMKNIDWGAMAYLSHSRYGKNEEVTYSSSTYTGGGSTSNSYLLFPEYSTSGSIYGIYDTVSVPGEWIANQMRDGTDIPYGKVPFDSTATKYYDVYAYSDTGNNYTISHLGDATGETRSWYGDNNRMAYYNALYFSRKIYSSSLTLNGIFSFECNSSSGTMYSSRPVLIIK